MDEIIILKKYFFREITYLYNLYPNHENVNYHISDYVLRETYFCTIVPQNTIQ